VTVRVEVLQEVTDEVVAAFGRLLPQLSRSAPPLDRAVLDRIVGSAATTLLIARTGVGDPQSGVAGNYNLESVTAVVLGGTSLFGGRGFEGQRDFGGRGGGRDFGGRGGGRDFGGRGGGRGRH